MGNKKCFICENEKATVACGMSYFYSCPACGSYSIDHISEALAKNSTGDFFRKAPALAFERKLKRLDNYALSWNDDLKQVCIGDIAFVADYPLTFPEKLDRTLLNIARLTDFNPLHQIGSYSLTHAAFFLEKVKLEYDATKLDMLKLLKNEGLITYTFNDEAKFAVNLTIKGANLALDLERRTSDSKHAFLAMWFDDSLKTYRPLFETAVREAGYFLHIVDEVHHNEFIMDKVLNLIKEARFVIADLTCAPEVDGVAPSKGVRGGVYLEAGYAKGLGKQVIFTCRDDSASRARIHFDVKQVNTIFWNEDSAGVLKAFGKYAFVEYLTQHIVYTVGKGPVPQQ